jgi:hypothetical protein
MGVRSVMVFYTGSIMCCLILSCQAARGIWPGAASTISFFDSDLDFAHGKSVAGNRWRRQSTRLPTSGPSARAAAGGAVTRTRPLCPYPQVARYSGSGSANDAANFTCTTP